MALSAFLVMVIGTTLEYLRTLGGAGFGAGGPTCHSGCEKVPWLILAFVDLC